MREHYSIWFSPEFFWQLHGVIFTSAMCVSKVIFAHLVGMLLFCIEKIIQDFLHLRVLMPSSMAVLVHFDIS